MKKFLRGQARNFKTLGSKTEHGYQNMQDDLHTFLLDLAQNFDSTSTLLDRNGDDGQSDIRDVWKELETLPTDNMFTNLLDYIKQKFNYTDYDLY